MRGRIFIPDEVYDWDGEYVVYEDSFIGPIPMTVGEACARHYGKDAFTLQEFLEFRFGDSLKELAKRIIKP